jgi:hypothetical protein
MGGLRPRDAGGGGVGAVRLSLGGGRLITAGLSPSLGENATSALMIREMRAPVFIRSHFLDLFIIPSNLRPAAMNGNLFIAETGSHERDRNNLQLAEFDY